MCIVNHEGFVAVLMKIIDSEIENLSVEGCSEEPKFKGVHSCFEGK